MKRHLFFAFLLSVLFFGAYVFYRSYAFIFFVKDQQLITLTVKQHFFAPVQKELIVEVAKSQASTSKGLSNRQEMKSFGNQEIDGMLFIFPEKKIQHFWMKEMLFELDICWLHDLTFVACQKAAKPVQTDQDLTIYSSSTPVNVVLETKPEFFSEEELNSKLFFK